MSAENPAADMTARCVIDDRRPERTMCGRVAEMAKKRDGGAHESFAAAMGEVCSACNHELARREAVMRTPPPKRRGSR